MGFILKKQVFAKKKLSRFRHCELSLRGTKQSRDKLLAWIASLRSQ
jgi:hypothetical protein